jgi:hypothetical protein
MSDFEVRAMLEQEAAYSPQRSQPHRRAQIPSVMTSLLRWTPTRQAA